jgi:CubicO group peptidase (beta-lactamase class C family)
LSSAAIVAMNTAMTWRTPSDAATRTLLTERIDLERQGVGMVVGVIEPDGRRVVAHGSTGRGEGVGLDGDTVFEIGSITKAFTALVLADMARRGEVALDDPAALYLPEGVTLPERGGRRITLTDLATHTSGLPRRPNNLTPTDPPNLYDGYTAQQLYACLASCELRHDIGAAHLYSNLGTGLLGHLLARRAGVDFGTLVRERITGPLGMPDTGIALSPGQAARFATPHDQSLRPVSGFGLGVLAGAGALRSTGADLLTFLAALLGDSETSLAPALAVQLSVRRPTAGDDVQALGWRISDEIVFHHGATRGHRCFLQFDPVRRAGVVVLTNTASARNDDLGFHLLSGRPLTPPAPAFSAASLAGFPGRYRFSARAGLDIERQRGRLFARMTRQDWFELLPVGDAEVRWASADARATLAARPDGHITGLVLRQDGRELRGTREG